MALATGLLLGCLSAGLAQAALPAKPDCAPASVPGLAFSWVTPDVVHNGLPLQIRRFESRDPLAHVVALYRKEWVATPQNPGDPLVYELRGYQVVAKLIGQCFYTLQARPGASGGAEGMLSVSQIPQGFQVPVLGQDFPQMSGGRVAADMTHRDPGKQARTLMLMNPFSVNANADFYRRVLAGEGWRITSDQKVPFQGGRGHAFAMTFKRGLHETSMVISRTEGGSSVLVNQVDKP